MKRRSLIVSLFFLYCTVVQYPYVLATVNWSGSPTSVTDDDIVVTTATQEFPLGHTYVYAQNENITINFQNLSTELRGNDSGASILHLKTDAGRTITLESPYDITTTGSISASTDHLLVLYQGEGTVVWKIAGNAEVVFGRNAQSGSATRSYIVLAEPDEYSQGPQVIFQRADSSRANQDELVTVRLDTHSVLGYVANANVGDSTKKGTYAFDPANTGQGLFEFNLKNGALFLVSPQRISSNPDTLTLADIHPSRLAGGQAVVTIMNSLGDMALQSGLWVTNQNESIHHFRFDPFTKLKVREDVNNSNPENDFLGNFKIEKQKGFVIGSNGTLHISSNAYLSHIGLKKNIDPNVSQIKNFKDAEGNWIPASRIVKQRNGSALIFDQSHNPWATTPTVIFDHNSALFVGSGVDKHGNFRSMKQPHSFMVDPISGRTNNGPVYDQSHLNFVLACEGDVNCFGPGADGAKIELLSKEVSPWGGYVVTPGSSSQFPSRTFDKDAQNAPYAYNKGTLFINGHLNLHDVTLVHTDENLRVTAGDDVSSEPAYTGGETYSILRGPEPITVNAPENDPQRRPKIAFTSSNFALHTSAAVTGIDLLVPNKVDDGIGLQNIAQFIFGYNGLRYDQGDGRVLLLGTLNGSFAYDNISPIGRDGADAHCDIMQTQECYDLPTDQAPYTYDPIAETYTYVPYNHALLLTVTPNDPSVIERPLEDITDQLSMHTVYLGQKSNISIGTNADVSPFFKATSPWLRPFANYFNFESSGGRAEDPRLGGVTGEGAIFVDLNGRFSFPSVYDVRIGCMVVRSRNQLPEGGQIKLPASSTHWGDSVGVTDWNLNFLPFSVKRAPGQDEYIPLPPAPEKPLATSNNVIVNVNEDFKTYRIDWGSVKNEPDDVVMNILNMNLSKPCMLDTRATRLSLPDDVLIIEGNVEQLQLTGSILSNPAVIKIRGPQGSVGEVVFLDIQETGELPSAIFILEDGGTVGIGSADVNSDSAYAATTLGRGGVIAIAGKDGGTVFLNEDVTVSAHAPFYFGSDAAAGTVLRIAGEKGTKLNLDDDATLDLRPLAYTNLDASYPPIIEEIKGRAIIAGGNIVEITDEIELNVQPRARIVFEDGAFGLPTGILRFSKKAILNFVEYSAINDVFDTLALGTIDNTLDPRTPTDASQPHHQYAPLINYGNGVKNTNDFRVSIIGKGVIQFVDDAHANLPYSAAVGIETLNTVVDAETQTVATIRETDITIDLRDNGAFYIGDQNTNEGGVLQIGNVKDNIDHSISFTLALNGKNTYFTMGTGSVLGLNVIVAKPTGSLMNDILVDTAYNVSRISLNINDGTFDATRIYSGGDASNPFASLILIGDNGNNTPVYDLSYGEIGTAVDTTAERRATDAVMKGGSNIVYIRKGVTTQSANTAGLLAPIVLDQDGAVQVATGPLDIPVFHDRLQTGILAGTYLQDLTQNHTNLTAQNFFATVKTADAAQETAARDRVNVGTPGKEQVDESIKISTVIGNTIIRDEFADIFSASGDNEVAREEAVELGAAFAGIEGATVTSLLEIPV